MSASRQSRRTVTSQVFGESTGERWKERIRTLEVSQVLAAVWEAPTINVQLTAFKQFTAVTLKQPEVFTEALLGVLVEMHAYCVSRHPLQRAVASFLQVIPETHHGTVSACLAATVENVLSAQWEKGDEGRMQYLEALVENFPLGERALRQMMPLVLEYYAATVVTYSQSSRATDAVLIAGLKTSLNILHKTLPVVHQLLQSGGLPYPVPEHGAVGAYQWPKILRVLSEDSKKEWVEKQIKQFSCACEHLLMAAPSSIPNDVTMTAGMLYVVLLQTDGDRAMLEARVKALCERWLEPGSSITPFVQLAVCHALLAKMSTSVLVAVTINTHYLLLKLFSYIHSLYSSFTETSDRYIASRTIALWTTVARDCVLSLDVGMEICEALLPSQDITKSLLQYVWSLWEDPVDGIRHQCKKIFENIIGIFKALQVKGFSSSDFLQSLSETLLTLKSHTRGKYVLLSILSAHVPVASLLQVGPQLPQEIMAVMGHQTLACHAGELWSQLVGLHWQLPSVTVDLWCETWVNVLVQAMCKSAPLARQHIVQHCLPAMFHCTEKCMLYINESIQKCLEASVDQKLVTQLACLHCGRTQSKHFPWEENQREILWKAIHHADEQICLSALGLLCESHHTIEPPPPSVLPLVLQFVQLNANSQSPGFRHSAISAIKKLLVRLKDSSYALLKQFKKRKCDDPSTLISTYQDFLLTLSSQQFKVLHPCSSYQRRNFALSILQLLASTYSASTVTPETASIPPLLDFNATVTASQGHCLIHSLQDTYDANRTIALELLLKLPLATTGLTDPAFLRQCVQKFCRLVSSPKSVECNAASSIVRFLMHRKPEELNTLLESHLRGQSTDAEGWQQETQKQPHWATVHILCDLLKSHVRIARGDLVSCSVTHPMYGVLQSIRAVLEESLLLSPPSATQQAYHRTCTKLVCLSEEVAALVSPVVCSSSPEGFLPESMVALGGSQAMEEDQPPSQAFGSAQSLLLCCWHSMKEIALLLGFLVEKVPISHGEHGILSHQQLDTIAAIFIHQLTEARHRGAFEMAYAGFIKLCKCLWSSSTQELHSKPATWVQELLESLQSTSLTRLLSITRRSAGLPFYLQAILAAEPIYTGRPCLKTTLQTLLSISTTCRAPVHVTSQSSGSSVQPQPAAVHALNILRALYRDSRLADFVVPFISEGVIIAIQGFSASSWPVRNSSTLLFSALVTRIFGAKRVQDEHSMENKITGKEFFTRFPSLHAFLLQELKSAAELIESEKSSVLQPSLFPVLVLLTRLYATPLDDECSPTSLKPFLPLLMRCVGCTEWKTRVLVSQAISVMVTDQGLEGAVGSTVAVLDSHFGQNQLHGLLLTVDTLITDHHQGTSGKDPSTAIWLLDTLAHHGWLSTIPCPVVKALYLSIISKLLEVTASVQTSYSPELSSLLVSMAYGVEDQLLNTDQDCKSRASSPDLVTAQARFFLAVALHLGKTEGHVLKTMYMLTHCLMHRDSYVREWTLKELNSSLPLRSIREAVCSDVLQLFWKEKDEDVLIQVYAFLIEYVEQHGLDCLTEGNRISPNQIVDSVTGIAEKSNIREELMISVLQFLSIVVPTSNLETREPLQRLARLLEEGSTPSKAAELRSAVAQALGRMWKVLTSFSETVTVFCDLVVHLLQDVDCAVRDDMSVSVTAMLKEGGQKVPVDSANAACALQYFVVSLMPGLPGDDTSHPLIEILQVTARPPQPGSGNILFDEDPINNYMEEPELVKHVCSSLAHVPTGVCSSLLSQVHTELLVYANEECAVCPWDNPSRFMHVCKLLMVAKCLINLPRLESPCQLALKEVVGKIMSGGALMHPLLI